VLNTLGLETMTTNGLSIPNGGCIGSFATQNSQPRQVRKEAAVAVDVGAEV
jgi:hypothetical protein